MVHLTDDSISRMRGNKKCSPLLPLRPAFMSVCLERPKLTREHASRAALKLTSPGPMPFVSISVRISMATSNLFPLLHAFSTELYAICRHQTSETARVDWVLEKAAGRGQRRTMLQQTAQWLRCTRTRGLHEAHASSYRCFAWNVTIRAFYSRANHNKMAPWFATY